LCTPIKPNPVAPRRRSFVILPKTAPLSEMKIEREQAEGRNMFTGYGAGYVEVNRTRYTESLVVGAEQLVTNWPLASVDALAADHFAAVMEMKPGDRPHRHGRDLRVPRAGRLAPLRSAGIGVEVMDTPAACRTYNILLGEGRNVVAALIL
jgi:uncharacterized protein